MRSNQVPSPVNVFESVLRAAPEAILVVSPRGEIVLANGRAGVLFGYEIRELEGHPLSILLPPESVEVHRQHLARHFRDPKSRVMGAGLDLKGRKRDGSLFPVDISLSTLDAGDEKWSIAWITDLTAAKRASAAVHDAETRYRTLVEQLPAATYIQALDEISTTLYISPQIAGISGYSAQDWISNPRLWVDSLHPADRERVIAAAHQVDISGEPFSMDYRLITRGGKVIWVHDEAVIVRNSRGENEYAQGFITDVTERKLAEERLALAANILDTIVNIVLVADSRGMITYVSPSVERILGYTPEEILGEGWWEVPRAVSANGLAEERSYVMRAAGGETPVDGKPYEHLVYAKSGEPRWLVIQDAKGPGDLLIGVGTDITARKKMEQELRTERDFAQHVMTAMGQGLSITDADRRIIYLNPAFSTMLGYSQEEWYGRTPDALVAVQDHPKLDADAEKRRQGEITTDEVLLVHKDGRLIPSLVTSAPRRIGAEVAGTVSVFTDLTAQKKLEEAIALARDQALEASRLKSEFLAMMSHEIRTPMNSIVGMTELLLDTPLDVEQREFATIAFQSSHVLLEIINDILDFSKIEAGKLMLDHSEVEPVSVMEGAAEIVAQRAREKNLALVTYVSPELPGILLGDGGRLRQVVLNLLSNAVKFTERGEVSLRVVPESEGPDHMAVRVSVQDTGIGITADAQSRLFQAFTQADGGITRRYGGTGLGLAISKRIVEMMGGEIGVASEPGKGSTFWFTARLKRAPSGKRRTAEGAPLARRVLIVDDHIEHGRILQSYLAAWNVPAECVTCGQDALRALRDAAVGGSPFDAVLVDFKMPGMDGLGLASAIRAENLAIEPHLVLVSAYDPPGGSEVRSLFDGVLSKPIRQQNLKKVLQHATEFVPPGDKSPAETAPIPERKPLKGPRVLVVEDDLANQKMADLQLRFLGYPAQIVGDGPSALQSIRSSHASGEMYAVVLMDCMMPGMDGFAVTAEIRAWEATQGIHTPIVAMTANAMTGDREACFAAGMDDYISKPVQVENLRGILEKWVASSQEN